MEVHKHPHHVTHKKKWKEYLLEFFMLFLAVFFGFVAENTREHLTDNSKGHEYISAFQKDLVNDTLNITNWIQAFNSRINEYDSRIQNRINVMQFKINYNIIYET